MKTPISFIALAFVLLSGCRDTSGDPIHAVDYRDKIRGQYSCEVRNFTAVMGTYTDTTWMDTLSILPGSSDSEFVMVWKGETPSDPLTLRSDYSFGILYSDPHYQYEGHFVLGDPVKFWDYYAGHSPAGTWGREVNGTWIGL